MVTRFHGAGARAGKRTTFQVYRLTLRTAVMPSCCCFAAVTIAAAAAGAARPPF